MKKQAQQPSMDEWLLDPIHGLEVGDENNVHQAIAPTDFLTTQAFDYFSTIQKKRSTNNIEREIRRLISRSIWPRILIARCRLLLATSIPLMIDGHWDMVEKMLTFIRTATHYLGFFIHGLRLIMNMAHLMKAIISSESAITEFQYHLTHSWFELFTDTQWIISAMIPSDYLEVSCALMVLELVFIAFRSFLEAQRISHGIKKINDAINQRDLDPKHLDELVRAKNHAEAMLQHIHKKFVLNFGVTSLSTCLFVFRNILLPAMLISITNPLIPFVFAAVALLMSITNHYLSQYFDQNKPKFIKQDSTKHLFFRENQQSPITGMDYEQTKYYA